jgi:hypothetical protein
MDPSELLRRICIVSAFFDTEEMHRLSLPIRVLYRASQCSVTRYSWESSFQGSRWRVSLQSIPFSSYRDGNRPSLTIFRHARLTCQTFSSVAALVLFGRPCQCSILSTGSSAWFERYRLPFQHREAFKQSNAGVMVAKLKDVPSIFRCEVVSFHYIQSCLYSMQ